MLYIVIPHGYELKVDALIGNELVLIRPDSPDVVSSGLVFAGAGVSVLDGLGTVERINLEREVQAYYKDRRSCKLEIYEHQPLKDTRSYVEYCPMKKGDEISGWVQSFIGKEKLDGFSRLSQEGLYTQTRLAPETYATSFLAERAFEHRKDLRHIGDSPAAT